MTVGIVVVSHSRALAEAAIALAGEMVRGQEVFVRCAAGLDDGGFGTDAVAIADAITDADHGDGVVVLMDLGSAVLSAEVALELIDDEVREQVVLCPAPLVEGLVSTVVTAGSGAGSAEVAAEASAALDAKRAHLADGAPPTGRAPTSGGAPPSDEVPPTDGAEPADPPGTEVARFTVTPPHGLHARPSALVVQAVRDLDAEVWLRNRTLGTAAVPAGSLSRVATLGALPGHEIEVRATGPQAHAAVNALLTLACDQFGEAPAAVSAPAAPRPGGPIPASPGIGIGPVSRLDAGAVAVPAPQPGPPELHRERVAQAFTRVRADLMAVRDRTAREVGAGEAAVFDAQLLLLDDPELVGSVHTRIDDGADAAAAWAASVEHVERRFADLSDAYLQARAADVRALRDQVLCALGGGAPAGVEVDGVLVADELTPAQAVALDPARTAAVVLAHGSPTAHAVILLRARGIPAVVGAADQVARIGGGTVVAVDGTSGELVVDPDDATVARFRHRADTIARHEAAARAEADRPAVTVDGTSVLVGANLGSAQDAPGADLAGLVRTEFCFLHRTAPPSIDEQEAAYRAVAEAMGGRRVTLRTLDVGGDKPLDYLPMASEANPFLGVRGIRLALARPELLRDQLEAIVRVAHDHPVDVMFPMVSTLDELSAARGLLDQAVRAVGRGEPDDLRVGIMVEVPATALKAAAFAPHVDFLSIGTNDLTQYALAAERGNAAVAALADPFDPGVLALVAATCAAAGPDVLVAVCGEFAADERAVPLLLGLGVRELSVAPVAVARIKQAVRGVDLARARDLAARALAAPDAATVRMLR